MEVGHLLSFKAHEKLVDYFFEELAREPPHRYDKTSLDQIMRADREIFARMAELTRDGFKSMGNIPAKEFPLDKVLERTLLDPRIIHLMLPLPSLSASSRPAKNDRKREQHQDNSEINKLREEVKRLKSNHKGDNKGKGKGKGGDKGKGGKNKKNPAMPKELHGMNNTVDGKKLCFDYNMKKGCTSRGVNACTRGSHLCCYPGCGGEHPLTSCPAYHKAIALGTA